ncbi:hypothetical protein TeGR_g14587 [Tetraparma gracilis]|uniref:Uncharacterized protein n=1 Tax=Tetraparma gracilis TaxID=2962635 RepID=A0ABQ6NB20_9STRA|nr:hypothetical protein TeGR_g14587 [Tetraparma gracilis]
MPCVRRWLPATDVSGDLTDVDPPALIESADASMSSFIGRQHTASDVMDLGNSSDIKPPSSSSASASSSTTTTTTSSSSTTLPSSGGWRATNAKKRRERLPPPPAGRLVEIKQSADNDNKKAGVSTFNCGDDDDATVVVDAGPKPSRFRGAAKGGLGNPNKPRAGGSGAKKSLGSFAFGAAPAAQSAKTPPPPPPPAALTKKAKERRAPPPPKPQERFSQMDDDTDGNITEDVPDTPAKDAKPAANATSKFFSSIAGKIGAGVRKIGGGCAGDVEATGGAGGAGLMLSSGWSSQDEIPEIASPPEKPLRALSEPAKQRGSDVQSAVAKQSSKKGWGSKRQKENIFSSFGYKGGKKAQPPKGAKTADVFKTTGGVGGGVKRKAKGVLGSLEKFAFLVKKDEKRPVPGEIVDLTSPKRSKTV